MLIILHFCEFKDGGLDKDLVFFQQIMVFCACIPITLEIKMECWQHKRLSQGKEAGKEGDKRRK